MSSSQNQNASTTTQSSDPADTLRTARYSINSSSSATGEGVTASDIFGALDPAKLHPLAQLSDQLDYLNLEEDKTNELPGATTAIPSRGWGDDLCYGTGTTYLSGLGVGGLWGLREGYKRPLVVSNTRLRINSILNSVTRRGTFMGNSAGVMGGKLALVYNIVNSSIDSFRGKHDIWGGMAAGGFTGALYKSTAGVRPALAAATIMTTLAGTWGYLKRTLV
ncbi:hypothetical protein Clacol_005478 [Clathrus columnatus]|uniref:Uncharacterized protein n=1 Tax=Clathrus columnatus TaxID=1419009 RepID=A0AAV5AE43_9AGAM|nr:hypothetical protein Clacol_005478 [Clathrus columnatus]